MQHQTSASIAIFVFLRQQLVNLVSLTRQKSDDHKEPKPKDHGVVKGPQEQKDRGGDDPSKDNCQNCTNL